MPSRFEANFSDPQVNLDPFIDEVFSELKSGFLELPKGEGVRRVSCFRGGLSIPQEGDRRIHSLGLIFCRRREFQGRRNCIRTRIVTEL
jgi:hypothetical protein